jgi:hypothetical protein
MWEEVIVGFWRGIGFFLAIGVLGMSCLIGLFLAEWFERGFRNGN